MKVEPRHVVVAAALGLAVAAVSVFGGVWLRSELRDEPAVDGEVLLDEPGIYQQPADGLNESHAGHDVPDVALVGVGGEEVRLSEFRGEPLVVNVWFASCPPCQRELQDFADVHDEVGDRIRFVGIDPFDSVEVMERFASDRGVEYQLLRDPEQAFTEQIGVVAFPVTFFVSSEGEIVRQTGVLDADELRQAIAELF